MAGKYPTQSGLNWYQIKIKTVIGWIALVLFVAAGVFAYFYISKNILAPEKRAERAIEKARGEYAKLEKKENINDAILDAPAALLDEAEESMQAKDYEKAVLKAEQSYQESSNALRRLEEAQAGHKNAYFVSIEGQVSVKKKDTQEWTPGRENMLLYAGDLVKTGRNSGAKVMLFDGSQYSIKEDSLVLIQQSFEDPASRKREIAIKIDDGEVDVSTADNPYSDSSTTVSTPTATTTFNEKSDSAIEYNKSTGETQVSIYSGKAKMDTGEQSIDLSRNEKVKITANKKIAEKVKLIPAPVLIAPPHREIYETETPKSKVIAFTWEKLQAAKRYRLEIASSPMFVNPTLKNTRNTSVALKGFNYGSYFWRVSSLDGKGNKSKFSTPIQFSMMKKSTVDFDDKTPPPLKITSSYQLGEYYLISGVTEPGASLTVDNAPWDVNSDGTFKDLLLLRHYGINVVTFRAVDNAGNATERKIKLDMK